MKKFSTLLLIFITLVTFNANAQNGVYVGGDVSLIPSYEASKTIYLDKSGNKISDLITWLKDDCGWNTFRVRLFVNPKKLANDGTTFDPAVCQDFDYVKALGKRIKDAGCYFMLDFHYSDTWMDATHIQAPEEQKNSTVDYKEGWIYKYTRDVLQRLEAEGAKPDLVQVGNEIMYGFMGIKVAPYDKSDSDWDGYLKVLKSGCQAVRTTCPEAKIIIHTDRPCNIDYNKYYYSKLNEAKVPYDIIGLSYYPFWHGWLTKSQSSKANTNLETALDQLAIDFPDKEVQIVEAAYPIQWWPSKGITYDTRSAWPVAEGKCQGQHQFVKDLVAELAKHPNVKGLSYWCPEEAGNGDAANWDTNEGIVITGWMNRGFWWPSTGAVTGSSTEYGHWPLTGSDGTMTVSLLKDFLNPSADINTLSTPTPSTSAPWFTLSGARITKPTQKGIYINGNKKVVVK